MKKLALALLTSAVFVGVTACDAQEAADKNTQAAVKTETVAKTEPAKQNEQTFIEKVAVSLGTMYGETLNKGVKEADDHGFKFDKDLLIKSFTDALNGKPQVTSEEAMTVLQEFDRQIREKMEAKKKEEAAANLKAGKEFLEKNAKVEGIVTTESGLQYKIESEGKGPKPTENDFVKVTYKGTTIDGTVFDESKEPVEFRLNSVIKGWKEGLQLVNVGSKVKLFVPAELAYGEFSPSPKIKANSVLVFDVELLEIVNQQPKEAEAK